VSTYRVSLFAYANILFDFIVTDMLVAVLNTCTKEELKESDDALISPSSSPEESAERRKIIKNKILAVGRMARVFALLR
jgi:serine/threonine-protein phosphatase 2B catalytic subunit